MAQHYVDNNKRRMLGMIEILNDKGMNILHIDNTYIAFTEFEPANPSIGTDYITVKGQDLTDIIENAVDKSGYTSMAKTELMQRISQEPVRIREYSSGEQWIKYVALS